LAVYALDWLNRCSDLFWLMARRLEKAETCSEERSDDKTRLRNASPRQAGREANRTNLKGET
jgi:hypothetical protein